MDEEKGTSVESGEPGGSPTPTPDAPSPQRGGGLKDGSLAGEPEPMICPGNRRTMQRRRKPRRKLFGKRRKEVFLKHLAMTANVTASAEAAGVCVTTVYAHRMKDAEFRELWWIALEQGVAKLTALRLQLELERAGAGGGTGGGASPRLEVALDGPPDARQIRDFYALLQSMREHSRGLSGEAKAGRPGGSAGVSEVCREMAKRLKAFEVREQGGDGSLDTASPRPSPGQALRSTPTRDERDGDEGEA